MSSESRFVTDIAAFNLIDWTLLIVLMWSVVVALLRGFLRELFSLAGLILGILLASRFYGDVSQWLDRWSFPEAVRLGAAFWLVAFSVTFLTGLASRLLTRGVSSLGLGLVNRLAGAIFGFARGSLIIMAFLSALAAFFPTFPALKNSCVAPYFLAAVHAVSFVLPQPLQQRIDQGLSLLRL